MREQRVKRQIKKHKVISFDIFDTLFFRPFLNPADLFFFIEKATNRTGYATARLSAEAVYYKYNTAEATIHDIYNQIPDFIDLKDYELETEEKCLRINSEIKKLYDYAISLGKRVVFASDMYLPKTVIEKILEINGIRKYELLLVSNDIQSRKSNGQMYDFMVKALQIKASKILHIGDNRHSDFIQAKKHGLDAICYEQHKKDVSQKRLLIHFSNKNIDSLEKSILTAQISQYKETGNYWEDFGYRVAGPFVYAYACWIKSQLLEKNIHKVLFVARDGYVLKKVFDLLNDNTSIVSYYVYAPRGLFYTTNIDLDNGLDERYNILCQKFGKDTNGLSCKEYVLQNIEDFKVLAEKEKQHAKYGQYLRNYAQRDEKIAVVDAGSANFSAQKLIQTEMDTKVVGLYLQTSREQKDWRQKLIVYDFVDEQTQKEYYQKEMTLQEFFMHSPEPPIETITDAAPVFREEFDEVESIRMKVFPDIERGILHFADDMKKHIDIKLSSTTIFNLLDSFLKNPTKQDIAMFMPIKQTKNIVRSAYEPMLSAKWHIFSMEENLKLTWRTPWQKFLVAFPFRIIKRGRTWIKFIFFPNAKKKYFSIPLWRDWEIHVGKYIIV